MLKINEIKPIAGSNKQRRRIGRGTGSGKGCTAGKGNNGHSARSGSNYKPYFEGGQTPLTRRLPKRGFHSPFKIEYQIVNIGELAKIDFGGKEITAELLFEKGLLQDKNRPVKILGEGDVNKPLIIKADSFSKSAKEKIEKAKGKIEAPTRV
jgi:large subunit ribosomal protein L15